MYQEEIKCWKGEKWEPDSETPTSTSREPPGLEGTNQTVGIWLWSPHDGGEEDQDPLPLLSSIRVESSYYIFFPHIFFSSVKTEGEHFFSLHFLFVLLHFLQHYNFQISNSVIFLFSWKYIYFQNLNFFCKFVGNFWWEDLVRWDNPSNWLVFAWITVDFL